MRLTSERYWYLTYRSYIELVVLHVDFLGEDLEIFEIFFGFKLTSENSKDLIYF